MICHSDPFAAAISGEKGEESAVLSAAVEARYLGSCL
jgi:hypothetical protein